MADTTSLTDRVDRFWDEHIVPTLIDYIRIPNKSPSFDPDWEANGHMEAVLQLALTWIEAHPLPGATVSVGRLPARTPLILIEIPGDLDGSILMYGHLDKQPEMEGWHEDKGPWIPVMEDGKLYGRGGADDGYALFASVCAVQTMIDEGISRPRIVIIIEFSEESGSPDLPYYVEHFKDRIGTPDLVVCLDSGAGDYDRLWSTTSLRGMLAGTLRVEVLRNGVHSGDASGIVPSSFRILRGLLDRIEDPRTGRILVDELHVEIPESRVAQADAVVASIGDAVSAKYPWLDGMTAMGTAPADQILARTWRPTLSYTGVDGIPAVRDGGNVLRPFTELKLSVRLPPTADAAKAGAALTQVLEADPPYGARVTANFGDGHGAAGWNAPDLAPWLETALETASQRRFGTAALHMGEGGTIPFMAMLHEGFPDAQFLITGVLGPESNAHGPNEFLHIPYAKKLTACVVDVLEAFGKRGSA
jgi:acetylornithine deacetylase/succinyl-diaminopimelate desuccinylase-like protein